MTFIQEVFSRTFKSQNIRYAFAYGSGVLKQIGYAPEQLNSVMIDLMLVVDSTKDFHGTNLKVNISHYSSIMSSDIGQRNLLEPVQRFGAGVYFNTDIPFGDGKAKYGIVQYDRFRSDLSQWDTLYLAGRLHKPVHELIGPDEEISELRRDNLIFALHSALLMLPEKFNRLDLLQMIVGLSYLGDIRQGLAENPRKIRNIAEGQFEALWSMYEPLLAEVGFDDICQVLQPVDWSHENWVQEKSQAACNLRVLCLPSNLRRNIGRIKNFEVKPGQVHRALARIVRWPSFVQSAKGVLTAGPSVSLKYLASKFKKRIQ